jgi:two-component system NarL family response regulator
MPKKDGLQVITELMAHRVGKPRIIVMTTYQSEEDIRRALKAGAKGYLVKGTAPQQIREAVRAVAAGKSLLPASVAAKFADSLARPELSKREHQVLKYMANGRSNKEIGQTLSISENTVKAHVQSVLTKLDAMGRTEAIAIAIKRGLINLAN